MAATAAVTALAGCGGGATSPGALTSASADASASASAASASPSPSRPAPAALVRDVVSAVKHATGAHVHGAVPGQGGLLSLNLRLTRYGQVSGTFSSKSGTLTVLKTGDATYMEVNAAFLKSIHAPAAVCAAMCGKYVRETAPQARNLLSGLSWSNLVGYLAQNPPAGERLSDAGKGAVGGQPVWKVRLGNEGVVDIAVRAPHYPLRLSASAGQSGVVTYTQWNSVEIPPSPPGKIVTMPQLTDQ